MTMKRLDIVGFGPGDKKHMTYEAYEAIENCQVIVGFTTYTNLIKNIFPDKTYENTGMGKEVDRVRKAFEIAATGKYVCLVCSGDASVYGMAGLAYELSEFYEGVELNTISGVTAALSGSALLGAACGNDLCLISLSDYHTSWIDIEKRLRAAAQLDFVISLYNPCSKKRPDSLKKACEILLLDLPNDRICGVTENIGRKDEKTRIMPLKDLLNYEGNMFSTIFIGNSKTKTINNKMVTPRGYKIG